MAAYAVGTIDKMNDPEGFGAYQKLAGPTVAQYGGKVIVGGMKVEVTEGDWSPVGAIVIEFENMAKLKEWYNSPEYHPLISQRTAATDGKLLFIDGD